MACGTSVTETNYRNNYWKYPKICFTTELLVKKRYNLCLGTLLKRKGKKKKRGEIDSILSNADRGICEQSRNRGGVCDRAIIY